MIDFHSHILPDMDDGASSVDESLEMLRASKEQGVDIVYATPHFYAMDESPKEFVKRRQACYEVLKCAMEPGMPEVRLGAEVFWFPGMSFSEEVKALNMQGLPFLMVEPPMDYWPEGMISEIELMPDSLHLLPVIAHADRYARLFGDEELVYNLSTRRVLIQFNMKAFLGSDASANLEHLKSGRVHFLGSDMHNLRTRHQNFGEACEAIRNAGCARALSGLNEKALSIINKQQESR